MSFRDKTFVLTFLSGLFAGVFLTGTFLGFRSLFRDKHNIKNKLKSSQNNDKTTILNGINELSSLFGYDDTYSHIQPRSIIMNRKDNDKIIKEIDKAPLELRKRFDNKGYVFINQNLATVNTELNEFVELMRKYDLYVLDGCRDPDSCSCNFRHKRCRLFMIRKYSNSPDLHFFAPSCSGVTVISPSNKDIANETPIHEFVQMFLNKFSDRVMDLVSYVSYIIDPHRTSEYVVDVTMIADPYDRSYKYSTTKGGYGQPTTMRGESSDDLLANRVITHSDDNMCTNHKCSLAWHQDHFIEAKTNQAHAYDFVALFVLNANNVTPHKLMIGKLKSDVDTKDMTLEQIQEHIIPLTDSFIDNQNTSDIGYVIDQRKRYFHKHSDFEYLGPDSKRNVVTIRIKYLK